MIEYSPKRQLAKILLTKIATNSEPRRTLELIDRHVLFDSKYAVVETKEIIWLLFLFLAVIFLLVSFELPRTVGFYLALCTEQFLCFLLYNLLSSCSLGLLWLSSRDSGSDPSP